VIKWFGRSKPEHPLAEEGKVRELIARLPVNDSAQALGAIVSWLESMKRADDLESDPRIKTLDLLDAASAAHEHALMQEYLATQRHKKSHEQKLWSSANRFWRELGEGYLHCLQQHDAGATLSDSNLQLIAARAMHTCRQQLKWALLRYETAEQRVWDEMARLYQRAEGDNFTDSEVQVHPASRLGGSIKQEYLKALMLAASSTETLQPVCQGLAVNLVAFFASKFVMEDGPYVGCTHWIDLAAPRAPVRMMSEIPDIATVRFIGAGEGLQELEQLSAHISYTRSLPPGIDLGGNHDLDLLLGVLKHLQQDWAGKTQARRHERRRVATRITVVPGMNVIVKVIEFARNDSLDFSHLQVAESWIVEDMSEGGYGAVIPALVGDWVEVGSMIGVEGETFRDWRIGVIRRVTRSDRQQRVGVQILGSTQDLFAEEMQSTERVDPQLLQAKLRNLARDSNATIVSAGAKPAALKAR
jgi:hypothetical protein